MQKINWINGQAGGTPLSAENLNLMQDYIEEAMEGDSDFTADDGYVRLESGLQIAWKTATVTGGGNSWANLYYSDHTLGAWKASFETFFCAFTSVDRTQYWSTYYNASKTNTGTIRLFRPNSSTDTVKVAIIGIGTWK